MKKTAPRKALPDSLTAFAPGSTQPADWVMNEFAQADLPDERHRWRLQMMTTAFAQKPTAPIPEACPSWAEAKGAYRFLANDRILAGGHPGGPPTSHPPAGADAARGAGRARYDHAQLLDAPPNRGAGSAGVTLAQGHWFAAAFDPGHHARGPAAGLFTQRRSRAPGSDRPPSSTPAGRQGELQVGGKSGGLPKAGPAVSGDPAGQHC